MSLVRLPGWEARLAATVRAAAARPFSWATHNCAFFAADCVLAVTGIDPAADFRSRFKSRREAFNALRETFGTADLAIAVTERVGPEIPPGQARRGDLAGFATRQGLAVGVISAAGRISLVDSSGLSHLPLTAAKHIWRVG